MAGMRIPAPIKSSSRIRFRIGFSACFGSCGIFRTNRTTTIEKPPIGRLDLDNVLVSEMYQSVEPGDADDHAGMGNMYATTHRDVVGL